MAKESCPNIPRCAIFPLMQEQGMMGMWRAFYCDADWQTCARYKMSQTGRSVPITLLPNGQTLSSDPRGSNK